MLKKLLKSLSQCILDERKETEAVQTGNDDSVFTFILWPKQNAEKFFQECGNNFCEMNFKNFRGWCRVLSVYDGDTITVGIPYEGKVYKQSIRMSGIDTPEIKSENKERAVLAKERLIKLITNDKNTTKEMFANSIHLVWFECSGFDKYRRLLGSVKTSPDGKNFSDILIQEGFGKYYDGGKKS